ncbi:MAG: hypothetical protein LBM08_05970 [Dysgonamonadaceae bacterium]|nr:hypothetical protein [Dysgonamonadaceae bacterium]
MKKIILLTTLCLSLATGTAFTQQYGGGSGTASDPFLISSRAHMEELARMVNGGTTYEGYHFKLTTYLAGITTIIGSTEDFPFSGIFDGNGHTIELNINTTGDYAGVFGYLSGTTVKNINVRGKVVLASPSPHAGSICGYAENSTVDNCFNIGNISATSSVSIPDCIPRAGGICGSGAGGIISNCSNAGSISAVSSSTAHHPSYAGGICGGPGTTISNCSNTGNISAASSSSSREYHASAGGICGHSSFISKCYNTGNISATDYAGGICGYESVISNCFNTGNISSATAGGICGSGGGIGTISNCFAVNTTITARGNNSAGRIESGSGRISNCYALTSMKINGLERRSMKADSKDGADREEADFKNESWQSWLTSVLKWDFEKVWTIDYRGWLIPKGVNIGNEARNAAIKAGAFSDLNAYFEILAGRNLSSELKAQRANIETVYTTATIPETEFTAFSFLFSAHFVKADNIFRKPHYMASATILQKEMFRLNAKYMSKEVFDHYNKEAYILDKRLIIAGMPAIFKDLVDHKDEMPDFYTEAAIQYYFAYYEISLSYGRDDTVKYEKYSAFDKALSIFLHIVESEYLNKKNRLPFMKGEPYTSLFE